MPIIEVDHITKEYRLGALVNIKQSLINTATRLQGKLVPERPLFKALNDISFSVEPGEVVGIIGHNGAGKSTLLKILAGITTQTTGTLRVNGRIAPLIEVGAGFVPDFTGRENVYLNGSILGLSRKDINRKFDEIVSFSEIEEFIDTPVKRYSSGMQVKLAFAVATSINAEILIVDEVLAVGDLAFQRKCFDRIGRLISSDDTTVLLVSHNIRQIERISSRVIMLEHGKILLDDTPEIAANIFYEKANKRISDYQEDSLSNSSNVQTSGEVQLKAINLIDEEGNVVDKTYPGAPLRICLKLEFKHDLDKVEIVVGTHTTDFFYLTGSSTRKISKTFSFNEGVHEIYHTIPAYPLASGSYCLRCAIFDKHRRAIFSGESLQTFTVAYSSDEAKEAPLRKLHVPAVWTINGTSYEV